jgi:hypothetical protein
MLMSRNIILLIIMLLVGLLVWCWWMLRIETFESADQGVINNIYSGLTGINTGLTGLRDDFEDVKVLLYPLTHYFNDHDSTNPDDWTYDFGVTGPRGTQGGVGAQGVTGAQGGVGSQGVRGRDGSSIFDVSKYMLNGDTDIFKKKNKEDDDNVPQPVNAYTTLFD